MSQRRAGQAVIIMQLTCTIMQLAMPITLATWPNSAPRIVPQPSRRSSVQHRCHVAATQVRTEAAHKEA